MSANLVIALNRKNDELKRQVAKLEGEAVDWQKSVGDLAAECSENQAKIAELQAQLDRATKKAESGSAAAFSDRGKRIRNLEQQQSEIRAWAKARGWKSIVPLYRWVIDHIDRATKPRPMSEAPDDGTSIQTVHVSVWNYALSQWITSSPSGWFPRTK